MSKIKEDVINELEGIIEKHSDVFCKYEISDDFKKVLVYEASGDIDRHKHDEIRRETLAPVQSLVWLYHNIKNGRSVGMGQVITVVEPGD